MTRIYIPLNASGLRSLDAEGAVAGAPFLAHAVTEALRTSAPTAGQDAWEYMALSDAAQSSAAVLKPGENRRIVAAADVAPELVEEVAPTEERIDSLVEVSEPVALNRIASFLLDEDGASEDDELLWYDVTELPAILAIL